MNNPVVDIALATFNGSKYLREMLDSIEHQSHKNYVVHICDDGSTDGTVDLIKNHALYMQGKAIIHDVSGGNGALKNFKRTIAHCSAEYVALCDQDDFWQINKLDILLSKMAEAESITKGPVLLFSDLEIVDSTLACIQPSFFKSSKKSSQSSRPEDFMISNHIPGCAMMFNRALKLAFEPIPTDVRMHDWWIAMIASFYGRVVFVDSPLIKYRQHSSNAVGAPGIKNKSGIYAEIKALKGLGRILKRSRQLKVSFLERHSKLGDVAAHQEFLNFVKNNSNIKDRVLMMKRSNSGEGRLVSLLAWCLI